MCRSGSATPHARPVLDTLLNVRRRPQKILDPARLNRYNAGFAFFNQHQERYPTSDAILKTIEKPKMTCLQLTMAVMLNMLGSSIILMPTKLAEVGTMSILAWLVTISGATTIAYVFAKCGMFSK